jgi:hypothetical protein
MTCQGQSQLKESERWKSSEMDGWGFPQSTSQKREVAHPAGKELIPAIHAVRAKHQYLNRRFAERL